MNKSLRKRAAAVAGAAAVALIGAGTAHAADGAAKTPMISGGTAIHSQSIVQLDVGNQYSTWKCTGEAISAQWVVTARHCTDSITKANVYYSNSTSNRGPAYAGNKFLASPYNDFGLIHLAQPHAIQYYSKLATSYTPQAGDKATIAGYGHRDGGVPSDGLYRADVKVLGAGKDLYGGNAIHVEGVTGSVNFGDSGAPLRLPDQTIIGVCSKGDSNDNGTGRTSRSYWANVTDSRSWIKQQTGV